jgi:hypothetical protein
MNIVTIHKLLQTPCTPCTTVEYYVRFDSIGDGGLQSDELLGLLERRWIESMEKIQKEKGE